MPVGVHGQANRRVSHDALDCLGMSARYSQPPPAGVPQGMEDKTFPVMVDRQQTIGLLAPGIFIGIVFRVSQPHGAGSSQIRLEDVRKVGTMGHSEDRHLGRFHGDMCPKFGR